MKDITIEWLREMAEKYPRVPKAPWLRGAVLIDSFLDYIQEQLKS